MQSRFLLGLLLCLILAIHSSAENLGVVLLDEIIFDKVLSRFPVALVKFDTAFPYGEKHDEYGRFAKEQNVLVKDLIIADVHTKDYGEKDNLSLLKRFRINEKELPTILLIKTADTSKWTTYPSDKPVTVDNLKSFIRRNTNLYIGLSGCIEEFDQIAATFMEKFNRNEDLEKLIETASNLITEDDEKQKMGTVYLQIMQRIREKGISFKEDERNRVSKLLSTKLTPQKKKDLEDRLNVLLSFRDATTGSLDKSEL